MASDKDHKFITSDPDQVSKDISVKVIENAVQVATHDYRMRSYADMDPWAAAYFNHFAGGQITVDVIGIAGQSNATLTDAGTTAPAMAPGVAYRWNGSSIEPMLSAPSGGSYGTMWAAFANEWFSLTGRAVLFVGTSVGGSALIAAANAANNWSPSGANRGNAVTSINAVIAEVGSNPAYALNNVYVGWCQGEREAQNIDGSTVTGTIYEADLEALASYFDTNLTQLDEMFVIQTGAYSDYRDAADWEEIRQAQEAACTDSTILRMAYRGAHSRS
jgi:hypothetical protein